LNPRKLPEPIGLPAGLGTKFEGKRAGLLLPEIPGMSKVSSTSGPSTISFTGPLDVFLGLNLVVPTNETGLMEVVCATRPTQANKSTVTQVGKETRLIFYSLSTPYPAQKELVGLCSWSFSEERGCRASRALLAKNEPQHYTPNSFVLLCALVKILCENPGPEST
jgi:hypothetical protein